MKTNVPKWRRIISRPVDSEIGGRVRLARRLVFAVVLSVSAGVPSPAADTVATQRTAAGVSEKDSARNLGTYLIGPGDVLQVFVWKETDFTRDVSVRVDGRISFPLLGDLVAAGATPMQLGEEISTKLSRFLATPQVTVTVLQPNSARFFVVGQVKVSGAFPFGGRATVLQGLAMAGGFLEYAKTDRILIIRGNPGEQTVLTVNYKKLETGSDLSQNVALMPGDTILVP